jgi:hypothetical protein
MPTEVASADNEPKICEVSARRSRFLLRMPTPAKERRVYDQEEDVPGVLDVRAGI